MSIGVYEYMNMYGKVFVRWLMFVSNKNDNAEMGNMVIATITKIFVYELL